MFYAPPRRGGVRVDPVRLGILVIAVIAIGSFSLPQVVATAYAGRYAQPKPTAKATEHVAPASLTTQQTISSYATPPDKTSLQIGDLGQLITPMAVASAYGIPGLQMLASDGAVTVYRVEVLSTTGVDNIRIFVDPKGMVKVLETVNGKERALFLNMGERDRFLEFFRQKLESPTVKDVWGKSFKVPRDFFDQIAGSAVDEAKWPQNPNSPARVDQRAAANQFGLTRTQIQELQAKMIPGSGKDITKEAIGALRGGNMMPENVYPAIGKGSALVETDAMLARRLAPFIEKLSEVSGKMFQPIERLGQSLASAFPAAAAKGAAALKWIAPYASGLGKILGVFGIIYGLFQMGVGAKRIYELVMEHGLGVLGTKEGAVVLLETLAAGLETLSAAAAVAALFSSATVVGGIGFGALSLILFGGALALRGTAWLVENWDNVVAFAQEKWEAMKDAAARGYAWVKDSASAAMAWGKEQVGKLAAGTKAALQRAGQWFGESVRGTVQVVEQVTVKVVEQVAKVVEWVEEKATTIWKTGVRMVEKIVDVAKDILEPVVRTGKRMVTAMVDVARQIPRTVYDAVTRIVDRVVPVVRQVTDWVTEHVQEAYQYATTITRNVTEWVTQRAQEAYEVVRQVPRQVTEWVTERVQEAYQVARQVSRQVKEWVTERVQEAYQVARQVSYQVKEWVTERVQEAYAVARTIWDTVTEWSSKQVKKWFSWFWKWVTEWFPVVKQVARTVYDTAYRWVNKSVQVARTVYDTVYDTAYRWVNKSVQVARTVYDTVYDTAYRFVDKAKQVTRTVYDTVRDTAYRWVDKSVQVVRQVADTVWQTGQRIVERVVPIVRNVTDYVTQQVSETIQVARTVFDTVVEKVPQLVEEAYTYVEQVPKRIVEQVKQLVAEEFEYSETVVEKIAHTRTDIVPVEREVIQNVTKQVEGWVPR